jgi:hypothetical protein
MLLPLFGLLIFGPLAVGLSLGFCNLAASYYARRGPSGVVFIWCLVVGSLSALGAIFLSVVDARAGNGGQLTPLASFLMLFAIGGIPAGAGGVVTSFRLQSGSLKAKAVRWGVLASLAASPVGMIVGIAASYALSS